MSYLLFPFFIKLSEHKLSVVIDPEMHTVSS
nr:MAG TPA: hypothetical protein [Caudoviricetes sp.]